MNEESIQPDLVHEVRALRKDLASDHKENASRMERVEKRMDEMAKAFPGGDPDGHRRYHELIIRREEQREKVRLELISKLVQGGTWSLLAWIGWLIVKNFKDVLMGLK